MIKFDSDRKVFCLESTGMSYVFAINEIGKLTHLYWGKSIDGDMACFDELINSDLHMLPHIYKHGFGGVTHTHSEYGTNDAFDFNEPCLRARFSDGVESVRLAYNCHEIYDEKDTEVLKITLCDEHYPLEVDLYYKVWKTLPLISRNAVIRNVGNENITLLNAKSATIDMASGVNYRLTHYAGCWGNELTKQQEMLKVQKTVIETNYLTKAAGYHQPFFALDKDGLATETSGEVFFGVLEYSGDFSITVEKTYMHSLDTVVVAGINDATSKIQLSGGEVFETPYFTIGFSDRGFEKMSEIFYDWEFDYTLPRGKNTDKAHGIRPIVYNSWYPYELNIDEEKIMGFIPKAKQIGAELFVIDDGWMAGRSNDRVGLGDWVIDTERFPNGLVSIADEVHKNGMLFGLWVEPEMANYDSEVYRNHPDWFFSEPNRTPTSMRHQTILDLSRDDLRDYTINWLDELIESAKLDYLKWDMNRDACEIGAYAIEHGVAVKYTKNLEYIWKHLNEKYPDLLLENCASGGGRADFGMLKYADRVNRSDNADPYDVLTLHEGYSTLFVPKLAGGAGNVAPSPYAIYGRRAPLEYRANHGMTGSYSVGINLLKCTQEEIEEIARYVSRFKKLRPALQDAYVYRIASIYDNPYQVLQYLKRDKSSFTVFGFAHAIKRCEKDIPRMRMRGLDENAMYKCADTVMSGKALMNFGISVKLKGDYASLVQTWERV